MPRNTDAIARDIAGFTPVGEDWLPLDLLLSELWAAGAPETAVRELLTVFERYPEEDGAGVVWSVVHGLESLPGYECELLKSVARCPSEFGVTMIGRLLNDGHLEVEGISLTDVLRNVLDQGKSERIRGVASRILARAS